MSDEDKALENEMLMWELNNRVKKEPASFEPSDPRYGPEHCEECDADMPAVRRTYGYSLCVGCQSLKEVRGRLYRH